MWRRRMLDARESGIAIAYIVAAVLFILGLTLYLALGFWGLAILAALIGLYFLFDHAGKTIPPNDSI